MGSPSAAPQPVVMYSVTASWACRGADTEFLVGLYSAHHARLGD